MILTLTTSSSVPLLVVRLGWVYLLIGLVLGLSLGTYGFINDKDDRNAPIYGASMAIISVGWPLVSLFFLGTAALIGFITICMCLKRWAAPWVARYHARYMAWKTS